MTSFYKNILSTVIAAAIIALVAILFRFDERLTRIETKLGINAQVEAPKNVTITEK